MKSITINGRRWFQKTYGNTYHSADIFIDGEFFTSTGKHYGYGDHYIHTAFATLEKLNAIAPRLTYQTGAREASWLWSERTGVTLNTSVVDVPRKKDL